MRHDIFFDEESHVYLVDGQEVPSVTTILQPLSNRSYSSVNSSVLEYARNRGSAVHEALQIYDLVGECDVFPEVQGYLNAYLDWQNVYRPEWLGVEEIVYCEEEGYIGTLDRLGVLNDRELAIVDIKTSNPAKEALVSVCCQTAAYEIAYQSNLVMTIPRKMGKTASIPSRPAIKRYGLFLKADGSYRFLDCEEYEKKYGFDGGVVFINLLATHRMITRLLNTKKGKKNGNQ